MGLRIEAFSGLTKPDYENTDEDHEPGHCVRLWPNTRKNELAQGLYHYEKRSHALSLSYGGYSHWRNRLAAVAGHPGPFYELLSFSDFTIGPAFAAKLARDFAEYDERAKNVGEDFYELYCRMRQTFELAANDGAVKFS